MNCTPLCDLPQKVQYGAAVPARPAAVDAAATAAPFTAEVHRVFPLTFVECELAIGPLAMHLLPQHL